MKIKIFVLLSMFHVIAYSQSVDKKISVVFVCEHGAARSLIASQYFKQLASENGLSVDVSFRGVSPDSALSSVAKTNLSSEGFNVANEKPRKLDQRFLNESDYIVTLDCKLPDDLSPGNAKVLSFTGIPSVNDHYTDAADSIRHIVKYMVKQLKEN